MTKIESEVNPHVPVIKAIYESISHIADCKAIVILSRVTYVVGGKQSGTAHHMLELLTKAVIEGKDVYYYNASGISLNADALLTNWLHVLNTPEGCTLVGDDETRAQADYDVVDSVRRWLLMQSGEIQEGSTICIDDWWIDQEPQHFNALIQLLEDYDLELIISCKYGDSPEPNTGSY